MKIINMRNGVVSFFLFLCFTSSGYAAEKINISEQGQALASIVVDGKSSAKLKTAAETLSHYLQRSTGADFPISYKPDARTNTPIQIRLVVKSSRNTSDITSGDQFTTDFPDRTTIIIAGESDWGTEFGVYDFLERFVGVRWLFPGQLGEYVPHHDVISVPMIKITEGPHFFMRLLSGLEGIEAMQWAYRNRMHDSGVSFHHNLANLFPPEKYAKIHPEFFPVIKGKRYIPADGVKGGWQPCFSAPGIVDEAAKNIAEYFEKHPGITSFSLGVNDSAGYCECEQCMAKVAGKKNSIGRPNYSEVYYAWANAVVAAVRNKYPDKWFGCLAYDHVQDPPETFKLNSHIIPFITYDRMKWIDPDEEQKGKYLNGLWEKKASVLGWYDYIYGKPYLVPRVYFRKMFEYLHFGAGHGVRAMYAEAYPNWGEGPKLYLYLRLLWNPDLDVAAILNDWYISAVGAAAAPSLAAYFEFWESYWTKRIIRSKWFTLVPSMYLPFYKTEYINDLTKAEIDSCRRMLEVVLSKAGTAEQKKRAEYFLQTFRDYANGITKAKSKSGLPGLLNRINKSNFHDVVYRYSLCGSYSLRLSPEARV